MQASKVSMKNSTEIFEHCASAGGGGVKKTSYQVMENFRSAIHEPDIHSLPNLKNSHHHQPTRSRVVCVYVGGGEGKWGGCGTR